MLAGEARLSRLISVSGAKTLSSHSSFEDPMYSVPLTPRRELRQRTAKWGGGVDFFFFQLCYLLPLCLAPSRPLYCFVAWKWPFSPLWTPIIWSFFWWNLSNPPVFDIWQILNRELSPALSPRVRRILCSDIWIRTCMIPTTYSDEIWHCATFKLDQERISSHIPEDLLDNSLQLYLPLGNLMVVLCNPGSLIHMSAMLEELLLRKRML